MYYYTNREAHGTLSRPGNADGGLGADTLTGGAGRDRFAYHSVEEGGDTITDFETGPAGDVIDLSVFAARWNWADADIVKAGYARFVQDGDNVLAQVDQDGGGDNFVTLATLLDVDASLLSHANFHTALWAPKATEATQEEASFPPDDGVSFNYPPGASANALYGTLGMDVLRGDDANNMLFGLDGDDRLYGLGGDDLLVGGSGNDTLIGGDGDDMLEGGDGADTLSGGLGSDTATYQNSKTGVTVHLADSSQNAGDATGDILFSIENVIGSDFGDTLIGSYTSNRLEGRGGDDILQGSRGSDTLLGGDGDDWLDGGPGKDVLEGGAGADSFYFASAAEAGDTILDFTTGEDKIVLSAAGFSLALDENFSFEAAANIYLYQGNAAYTASSGPSLLYNTTNGRLLWDADGHGEEKAQLLAILSNAPEITYDDFLIV
ncbi:MAG: M10 family metallopeptidase C-terminal domain-containing protein [Rhodomicrobiaceae bacterium]